MMRNFVVVIFLFLFIFGVPFSFLPFNSSKLVFILLLGWCFSIKLLSNRTTTILTVERCSLNVFYSLTFLCLLSFLYPILHGTGDYSLSYAYFIMLSEACLGAYLMCILLLNKYNFYELLKLIVFVAFLQSCIILLMFISESFRELIYLMSDVDAKQLMERYDGFRGFGLAGSVTYDLAVFLAINLMFITYLVSVKQITGRIYLVVYLVIFTAAIMTGRSAWIGIFLSVFIIFWNFRRHTLLVKVLEGGAYISLFSLVMFILIQNFYPNISNVFIDKIIPYAFEMFINLFDSGELSTSSTDKLSSMYFSVSESTFLLGDGYYKDPNNAAYYYMGTDAGYMRHILYYGLFPSMCLYFFYLSCFYVIYKKIKGLESRFILVSSLSLYYFLVHYKGAFLTGSAMNIKLFFILLIFAMFIPTNQKVNVND